MLTDTFLCPYNWERSGFDRELELGATSTGPKCLFCFITFVNIFPVPNSPFLCPNFRSVAQKYCLCECQKIRKSRIGFIRSRDGTGNLSSRYIIFHVAFLFSKSCDSSVGIALGYGLEDRGSGVRFPAGARNFSLHHRVQNGSRARPASYPMGIRVSFSGGKAAGA
jgi:hypothetical protein